MHRGHVRFLLVWDPSHGLDIYWPGKQVSHGTQNCVSENPNPSHGAMVVSGSKHLVQSAHPVSSKVEEPLQKDVRY